MKILAKILSFVFHPLLLPTYGVAIIMFANPYWFTGFKNGLISVLLIIFLQTFIFPLITVLLMKALHFIDDIYLRNQKQRFVPFIATMTFYFWCFLVIKSQQFPNSVLWLMLGSCITAALAFIANISIKISLHTMGMASLICVAAHAALVSFSDFTPVLILIILLAGIIGSARLYLKAHEPQEVISGYLIGFLGMMIASWFY
jgi:membrane-associated phospholipid phosphatase